MFEFRGLILTTLIFGFNLLIIKTLNKTVCFSYSNYQALLTKAIKHIIQKIKVHVVNALKNVISENQIYVINIQSNKSLRKLW